MGANYLSKLLIANSVLDLLKRDPAPLLARKGGTQHRPRLGELETYEVTKTTARVRVVIDGLKPLIMEAAMDYESGEESIIALDYENSLL